MLIQRKIDLSIYYHLVDLLPSNVTVVDGFPVGYDGQPLGELQLPTVAVERRPITRSPHELGGEGLDHFAYSVDIYATTKAQRDDLAYLVQRDLDQNNVAVYDYDEGFPPAISPTQIGTLVPEGDILNSVVYVFPDLVPKLYWRSVVDFVGYYNAIV